LEEEFDVRNVNVTVNINRNVSRVVLDYHLDRLLFYGSVGRIAQIQEGKRTLFIDLFDFEDGVLLHVLHLLEDARHVEAELVELLVAHLEGLNRT
jgi:hypothetical protein